MPHAADRLLCAVCVLPQIHTAQAEAYRAARMRRQLQQQEQWDEAEGKEPQAPCPGADPGAGGVAAAVVGAGGRAAEPVEGEVGDKDNDDDEGAGESESGLDDEEEEDSDDGGGGSGAVADRGRQEGPAAARRRWLAEPPRTGGAMRAARLAGLLYLAARCGGGGDNGGGQVALTLAEVAAACAPGCGGACDMFVLAQYAKWVVGWGWVERGALRDGWGSMAGAIAATPGHQHLRLRPHRQLRLRFT